MFISIIDIEGTAWLLQKKRIMSVFKKTGQNTVIKYKGRKVFFEITINSEDVSNAEALESLKN